MITTWIAVWLMPIYGPKQYEEIRMHRADPYAEMFGLRVAGKATEASDYWVRVRVFVESQQPWIMRTPRARFLHFPLK